MIVDPSRGPEWTYLRHYRSNRSELAARDRSTDGGQRDLSSVTLSLLLACGLVALVHLFKKEPIRTT